MIMEVILTVRTVLIVATQSSFTPTPDRSYLGLDVMLVSVTSLRTLLTVLITSVIIVASTHMHIYHIE
jgi:hypothetical protein